MKQFVWLLVAILLLLHHDFWNWSDDRLVFGFIPVGLFYHACLSIGAAMVWFLAVTFAWPKDLEETNQPDNFYSRQTVRSPGSFAMSDQTLADDEMTVRDDKTVRADEEQ